MYRIKRIFVLFALLVSVVLINTALAVEPDGFIGSATGDPPIVIGAGWSVSTAVPPAFFWDSSGLSGPFTFYSATPAIVYITDDFCKKSWFKVYDNGVLIGTTNIITPESGCSASVGPDAAYADPSWSSGAFNVGPGDHSITIEVLGTSTSGRGYIKVESSSTAIPEFPTFAIPIISVIGLMLLFERRMSK